MKQIFSLNLILTGLLMVSPSLWGQATETEKPVRGSLAFVNVIPLDTPTRLFFDQRDLKPEGFEKGSITSFLLFPSGTRSLICKNESLSSKDEPIPVNSVTSSIVVTYLLEVSSLDGKEKKQELRALVVPCLGKDGTNQRVLLVGTEKPMTFNINGKDVLLTPNQASEAFPTSAIKIETPEKVSVAEFSLFDAGNFLIVITPDPKGGFLSAGIRDE